MRAEEYDFIKLAPSITTAPKFMQASKRWVGLGSSGTIKL